MDASGDQDIKLQRSSPDRIAELKRSLPRFLWKSKLTEEGPPPVTRVRTLVSITRADRLISLLEPFQEWPQLLDPHLMEILQPLVAAFIEYLFNHIAKYSKDVNKPVSPKVVPLPRAICKILYTLCKVRGQKVITQFLDNAPRNIEQMLDALEQWSQAGNLGVVSILTNQAMVWEERFVMLLWLSHLMLAPFELVSLASQNLGTFSEANTYLRLEFHHDTPAVAKRLANIANLYLGFASKEREAAALLLSRLALRSDMRKIDLQTAIVDCALLTLDVSQSEAAILHVYELIGILSFLAKFIVSAENGVRKPLLARIYRSIQHATSDHYPLHKEFVSSATARKLIIKIRRALIVAGIEIDMKNPGFPSCVGEEALEEVIDEMFAALADKDTSVRIAASKALSVIAVPLESDMVAQIVESILEKLRGEIVWTWSEQHEVHSISGSELAAQGRSPSELPACREQSLVQVNPASWHGLVFTLSHLLFRGSMPNDLINPVLILLDLALHFEQRTSLGVSLGSNVRDAACFGLWSLARRYATADLKAGFDSTLRVLTTKLVVAATLDPAGNIRRGASAALQELIGRHAGEVQHGIQIVQIVDYHSVALRSRAMLEVARSASQIDKIYWRALLDGLLGWRGVGATDPQSRRQAAEAIGSMAVVDVPTSVQDTIKIVRNHLRKTSSYKNEVRHGLILALGEILSAGAKMYLEMEIDSNDSQDVYTSNDQIHNLVTSLAAEATQLWTACCTDRPEVEAGRADDIVQSFYLDSMLRSGLLCEAVCSLISALAWITLAFPLEAVKKMLAHEEDMHFCIRVLDLSLDKTDLDPIVLQANAQASERLFGLFDKETQKQLVFKWAQRLHPATAQTGPGSRAGATMALSAVFQHVGNMASLAPSDPAVHAIFQDFSIDPETVTMPPLRFLVLHILLEQLNSSGTSIELRCTTLKSLTSGVLKSDVITGDLLKSLELCLADHTVNRRGDVGSLVRIEAIEAVATVLGKGLLGLRDREKLAARICGLAVEKLDKVRWRAWNCLLLNWGVFGLGLRPQVAIVHIAQTSTTEYFRQMISFCDHGWIRAPLLEGFVTSAGAGSESVLQASRTAFVAYSDTCPAIALSMYCTTIVDIVHENYSNDRLLLPAMDFLGFLFDVGVLHRLATEMFGWTRLFEIIQRAQSKSTNIHKIEAAVKIYAGMALVPKVRSIAMKKLCQFLTHKFPKIRNVVADALFIVTQDEELLAVNWSKLQKEQALVIARFKERLEAEGKSSSA
ncbi:hypothetical protein N7G274_007424 [Stereocaulon virgatum]|uniref:Tubulin-specific chaperone D n=1 Tax=Stereocaulon virgatum TaxID=373712 RepID=A0ABR4A4Z4_9LECA